MSKSAKVQEVKKQDGVNWGFIFSKIIKFCDSGKDGLTSSEARVLDAIADAIGKHKSGWPGCGRISQFTKLSKRQCWRIIKSLENRGVIFIDRVAKPRSYDDTNDYRIDFDKLTSLVTHPRMVKEMSKFLYEKLGLVYTRLNDTVTPCTPVLMTPCHQTNDTVTSDLMTPCHQTNDTVSSERSLLFIGRSKNVSFSAPAEPEAEEARKPEEEKRIDSSNQEEETTANAVVVTHSTPVHQKEIISKKELPEEELILNHIQSPEIKDIFLTYMSFKSLDVYGLSKRMVKSKSTPCYLAQRLEELFEGVKSKTGNYPTPTSIIKVLNKEFSSYKEFCWGLVLSPIRRELLLKSLINLTPVNRLPIVEVKPVIQESVPLTCSAHEIVEERKITVPLTCSAPKVGIVLTTEDRVKLANELAAARLLMSA